MKRIITIGLLLACSYNYGQSIQLFYDNEPLNSGDTIFIDVPSDNIFREFPLDIVNTSSNNIELMAMRNLTSLISGARNKFCLGECYNETEDMSKPYPLNAGDTLSPETDEYGHFHTSYNAEGNKGVSVIQYTFYDDNDILGTRVSVYFRFNSNNVGIAPITDIANLAAYPNPTTGKVVVEHSLKSQSSNAKLLVSNVMGVTLKSIPILSSSDKTAIDMSDFAAGIYFYSLEVDGKISVTKKLIIK